MICQELEQFLYPYLDGEFDSAEQENVERHLAECERCTTRVTAEAQVQSLIREKAREGSGNAAPVALRAAITRRLHQDQRRAGLLSWARWGSAALVAATAAYYLQSRSNPKSRFVEDAALRHSRNLPYEVPAMPPEQLATWFEGKLNYRVPVPSLTNATLAGARLSNVRDRDAAYIGYEADGESGERRRVSVFVLDDSARELPTATWPSVDIQDVHGYRVASWRRGGIVYELVSDLGEEQVRQLLAEDTRPAAAIPAAGSVSDLPHPLPTVLPASYRP